MSKIKKLPEYEARKIAAGEVVERPVNILKELVENSIDASAENITIYIENSGKKLIRVIDDGCGMSSEDAQLCFEKHATSKISCLDDLSNLNTLGFRGEALSSISAISKVILITKQVETLQGTFICIEDTEFKSEMISSPVGTDITIKDMFYNVPARLKFLKKEEGEFRSIVHLFQSFCLAYKNIHFKLYHDEKLIYNCPRVQDIYSRVTQIWDHNLSGNMLEFSFHEKEIKLEITGLISNHQINRFNRSQIFFFVNNRWVKNQVFFKSMLKGYINVLQKNRFPVGMIFLSVPAESIDVNIHPRKEEIDLLNSKKIENAILQNVKKTLETNLSKHIKPNIHLVKENDQKIYIAATQTTFDLEQLPFFEPIDNAHAHSEFDNLAMIVDNTDSKNKNHLKQFEDLSSQSVTSKSDLEEFNSYDVIGQYKNCYILLDKNEGLFVIDQHAAHERILFELFSNRFNEIAKVKLIFPTVITLIEQNLNLLIPHFQILENYGIEVECFASDQIVIKSLPVHLKDISIEDLINQLISWIKEYQYIDKEEFFKLINEKLCAQMACKTAIKAGDKLTQEQISQLLNDLQKTENRFACPHGRPTGWLLNHYEIEKKFKRRL